MVRGGKDELLGIKGNAILDRLIPTGREIKSEEKEKKVISDFDL